MIIWLNGAFGAGKTQTAYELHRRLPGSYVYDPENAGFFIRKNLPPALLTSDFQDCPLWRRFNLEMLRYMAERYKGDVIVPMTVTNRAYYEELIGALAQDFEVRHIILCASREVLLKRLASRLEGSRSWGAQQISRCLQAFASDIPGLKLQTGALNLYQVTEAAAALAGVELAPDLRSAPRRAYDRLVTKIRHIR